MSNKETWATSIQFLMETFRSTLAALCPYMDKLKIKWHLEDAYDDWDEIAQCLYKNMVLRSINFSDKGLEDLTLPKYGMAYDSYLGKSFIGIIDSTSRDYYAFVGFSTLEQPFDQTMLQKVSAVNFKISGPIIQLPSDDVKFSLLLQKANQVSVFTDFVVDL